MRNIKSYGSLLIVMLVAVMFISSISGCSTTPEINDDVNDAAESAPIINVIESAPEVVEPVVSEVEVVQEETTTPITEDAQSETNTPSGACVDSDDGLDYSVKGTVTITNDDGSTKKYADYCRHGSSEGQVFEYYCANDEVASESYNCPKGCNNNGACY